MGFFSTYTDIDGVVRRSSLLIRCGGELYVSLDLAIAELALGTHTWFAGEVVQVHADEGVIGPSGALDLAAPIHSLGAIFVGGPAPSAPFPACGPETTDDDLMVKAR